MIGQISDKESESCSQCQRQYDVQNREDNGIYFNAGYRHGYSSEDDEIVIPLQTQQKHKRTFLRKTAIPRQHLGNMEQQLESMEQQLVSMQKEIKLLQQSNKRKDNIIDELRKKISEVNGIRVINKSSSTHLESKARLVTSQFQRFTNNQGIFPICQKCFPLNVGPKSNEIDPSNQNSVSKVQRIQSTHYVQRNGAIQFQKLDALQMEERITEYKKQLRFMHQRLQRNQQEYLWMSRFINSFNLMADTLSIVHDMLPNNQKQLRARTRSNWRQVKSIIRYYTSQQFIQQ